MSGFIKLEQGDTPESLWDEAPLLFRIQVKNRIEAMSVACDENEIHILESTPYGKRIYTRIWHEFASDIDALRFGNDFLDTVRKEPTQQPLAGE